MAEELWRYFPFISRIGHQIEQSKAQKELSDLQRLALLATMFQEYPELAGVPSVQQMAERRGYPMMPTHERPMRTPMPSGTQPVGTPPTLAPIREGLRVGRQPWIPKGKTEKLIDQFRRLYAQKGREFPGKGQLRIGAEGGVSFQPPDVPKLIRVGETERLVHPETGEVITPASKKEEKKPRKPDYTYTSVDKKGNPVEVGVCYDAEGKKIKEDIIGPSFQKPTGAGEQKRLGIEKHYSDLFEKLYFTETNPMSGEQTFTVSPGWKSNLRILNNFAQDNDLPEIMALELSDEESGNPFLQFVPLKVRSPKTKKYYTAKDVMETAKQEKISPEQVLRTMGLIE